RSIRHNNEPPSLRTERRSTPRNCRKRSIRHNKEPPSLRTERRSTPRNCRKRLIRHNKEPPSLRTSEAEICGVEESLVDRFTHSLGDSSTPFIPPSSDRTPLRMTHGLNPRFL